MITVCDMFSHAWFFDGQIALSFEMIFAFCKSIEAKKENYRKGSG